MADGLGAGLFGSLYVYTSEPLRSPLHRTVSSLKCLQYYNVHKSEAGDANRHWPHTVVGNLTCSGSKLTPSMWQGVAPAATLRLSPLTCPSSALRPTPLRCPLVESPGISQLHCVGKACDQPAACAAVAGCRLSLVARLGPQVPLAHSLCACACSGSHTGTRPYPRLECGLSPSLLSPAGVIANHPTAGPSEFGQSSAGVWRRRKWNSN